MVSMYTDVLFSVEEELGFDPFPSPGGVFVEEPVSTDVEMKVWDGSCVDCGAYEPYEGHCGCVSFAEVFSERVVTPRGTLAFGGVEFLLGAADDDHVVMRPYPKYPYSDGYCWLLCFSEADRDRIIDEVEIVPELTITQITRLHQQYEYSDQLLELTKIGKGRYHFSPGVTGSRHARTYLEWLAEIYSPAGLHSQAKNGVFGGMYQNWQTEGEVGRVSRSTWLDVTALSNLIKESFSSPFSKQAHREVIVRLIQESEVRGIVGYQVRFPARGTYVSLATSDWGETLADLMSSASYRDRSKDERAKHGVDEPGNVREETYNDALTGFAKTLRKIWQNLMDAPGAFTRETFEDNFKTSWSLAPGEVDDSVPGVWEDYKGKSGIFSALPWFTSQAMDSLISQLHRKNPTVNADLASIGSIVANAMSMTPPFSKTKTYAGGYHVSACSGDWADKLIRLFLCAGHQDGTKDEKFKRGQVLPTTLQFDKSDMVRQFYTTLTDLNRQYAEHAHFVTSEAVLMRILNLHKKIPPSDASKVIDKIKLAGDWKDDRFMDWVPGTPSKFGKKIPANDKPSTQQVTRLTKNDEVFLPFYYYQKKTDGTYINEKEIKLSLTVVSGTSVNVDEDNEEDDEYVV